MKRLLNYVATFFGTDKPAEQRSVEMPGPDFDWQRFHADNVAKLDQDMVKRAVEFLRRDLGELTLLNIRQQMSLDPQSWWCKHHFGNMMAVRNALRGAGFGEKEFGIDNLDDYAVGLVEMAARNGKPLPR